jgi:hypothetical protein
MTTFTRKTVTEDTATGQVTSSSTTLTGSAIRVRSSSGELARFAAGGLVHQETATLFWTPTTYGDRPRPGDTVEWEDLDWTVVFVDPIAPDGVTIAARVGVVR